MKLATLARKHERRSDEELRIEIDAAREELRGFRRAHSAFRDRTHTAVEESIAAADAWLEGELARFATIQAAFQPVRGPDGQLPVVVQLAAAAALPALAERWHAAVDAAEGFSELTSAQFAAEERKRVAAITALEVELERRQRAAEKEAAERELQALEERVTA